MNVQRILIDGNNFLYRAYYATERAHLTNSAGQPTGAIKTYVNMLYSLQHSYPEVPIAVIFDAKVPCFRKQIYPDYKANRKPMPEDLRAQVDLVYDIIKSMGLPLIVVEGVEADDVLASYAKEAERLGYHILVATGDKDLAAIVSEHVQLLDTMKNVTLDCAGVKAKYGVPPHLITDLLALKGDTVDNIPGMAGVGDKTATVLLNDIGGIEQIQQNLDKVAKLKFRGSGTFAQKFKEQEANILISKALATLKTDVALPIPLAKMQNAPADHQHLLEIYRLCDFKSLIALEEQVLTVSPPPTTSTVEQQVVTDLSALQHTLATLQTAEQLALYMHVDTNHNHDLVGIGLASPTLSVYVPIAHNAVDNNDSLLLMPEVLQVGSAGVQSIGTWLQSLTKPVICFDAKSVHHIFAKHQASFCAQVEDVLLEAHMLNATQKHTLESLISEYSAQDITLQVANNTPKKIAYASLSIANTSTYVQAITSFLITVHTELHNTLAQEPNMLKAYHELELPLIDVLYRMEEHGIRIDTNELAKQALLTKQQLDAVQKDIFMFAGEEFNLDSPAETSRILFENLHIPPIGKKSASGAYSTNNEVLVELADKYAIALHIQEYRSLRKFLTTYIEKLPKFVDGITSRVHTTFHQDGTSTGRLSSSDPGLQNIPVRLSADRDIRKSFIAPEGYVVMSADYSQIELRLMAHIANEQHMIKAFNDDLDIHNATASEMYNIPLEQVTPQLRRSAKAINFGLIYGMSVHGLAKNLHIERTEAKKHVEAYFAQYPGVKTYMEKIDAFVTEHGYVTTLGGRKLYFADVKRSGHNLTEYIKRAAINAPMQGSAAEIIKIAMLKVQQWIDTLPQDHIFMILQVHDELVFEVRKEFADEYAQKISQIMSSVLSLQVPLKVGISYGQNWSEAH